jgi:peptidoglycan/LPS O-acetylase OafA/YrhL
VKFARSTDPLIVTPVVSARYPALDGLRGIAALMIMLHHFVQLDPLQTHWYPAMKACTEFLWIGVDLFFVISGFLITGILLDHRRDGGYFRVFYARRTLRIFPLYYGVLLVSFYVMPHLGFDPKVAPGDQIAFWTYTSNFLFMHHGWTSRYLTHFWSLAIEEQFYLVMPAAIFFIRSLKVLRSILPMMVVTIAIIRMALIYSGADPFALLLNSLTRSDSLLIGAWIAIVIRDPSRPLSSTSSVRVKVILVLVASVAFALVSSFGSTIAIINFDQLRLLQAAFTLPLVGACFAWCVLLCTSSNSNRLQRLCSHQLLKQAGKYSYGLYVFHVPVIVAAKVALRRFHVTLPGPAMLSELLWITSVLLPTILVAVLSWHLFEKQFLRLKSRLEYRRRQEEPLMEGAPA